MPCLATNIVATRRLCDDGFRKQPVTGMHNRTFETLLAASDMAVEPNLGAHPKLLGVARQAVRFEAPAHVR